jgi:hypothetical protein
MNRRQLFALPIALLGAAPVAKQGVYEFTEQLLRRKGLAYELPGHGDTVIHSTDGITWTETRS